VTEAIQKVWQLIIWEKWVKGNCPTGLRAIRDGGYSESVAVDYLGDVGKGELCHWSKSDT
jgi:hypothetical protein